MTEIFVPWYKRSAENEAIIRKSKREARARYVANNKELVKEQQSKYYQGNKGKFRNREIIRRRFVDTTIISRLFRIECEAFYIEARRLTEETGVNYVVDHYWPINGKGSCGLHVPWNLRVITQGENDSKGNKEPEDTWSSVVLNPQHQGD